MGFKDALQHYNYLQDIILTLKGKNKDTYIQVKKITEILEKLRKEFKNIDIAELSDDEDEE